MSSIVINTPNGTIGRKVADALLDAGESLTVISRTADKAAALTERGAKLVEGSIDDAAVIKAAFDGADRLFWLTPPAGYRPDYHEWSVKAAEQAAALASEAGIKHVVVLSSVGAHSGRGTGPVGCLLEVEEAFKAKIPHVTILRPGFFFENLFRDQMTIQTMGKIFSPAPGDKKFPMIGTDDIAAAAVDALRGTGDGHQVLGLHGPEDLTYTELAKQLSEAWGREVSFVQVGLEDARGAMVGAGLPQFAADIFVEMYDAMLKGAMDPAEARDEATTTPSTFRDFAKNVFVPALAGASA
ncbi:MAG: NmrA family NAD(P)-binding protein [Myxococcales bacterium]|nr:NmrA family NAD(P)-binding protein [Myxococcales bacterium]